MYFVRLPRLDRDVTRIIFRLARLPIAAAFANVTFPLS